LAGKKKADIEKEFHDIDRDKLAQEVQTIRENSDVESFWDYDGNGKVKVSPFKFKVYLKAMNFHKYFPAGNEKTFFFIRKINNFLEQVNEYKIKDTVMNQLENKNELEVFDHVGNNTRLFSTQYLSMIDTAEVNFIRDEKDFGMIYYQNAAVKVKKDGTFEVYDYDELDFHLWKDQVIKRDFIMEDHHDSVFRSFLWLVSGQEVDRYNTFKSIIGYMLHSYKNNANNVAVILNDEVISENPNGGSGKGIIMNAIGHMKKLSIIDGKTFDFNKSFAYQTVSTDCQVLTFDDVKKNFDFEKLFSLITEGITIEYKGKDAIKLPVQDSPKILITTNYTIKAEGGSFKRRMFEAELSSYFGSHYTPEQEFGHQLFDGWDEMEWARFDHFMINCMYYYLQNGLVKYEHKNLPVRKLINETSNEFVQWMGDKVFYQTQRIFYKDWFEEFLKEYPDFKKFGTQRMFNTWLRKYFGFKKWTVTEKAANGKRFYELTGDDLQVKPDNIQEDASDSPF
jgi:hypothetical protein